MDLNIQRKVLEAENEEGRFSGNGQDQAMWGHNTVGFATVGKAQTLALVKQVMEAMTLLIGTYIVEP